MLHFFRRILQKILSHLIFGLQVDSLVMLDLPKPISRDRGVLGAEMSKAIDAFQDLERKLHRASPVYSYDIALDRLLEGTKHGLTRQSAKILMVTTSDISIAFCRFLLNHHLLNIFIVFT